MNSYMTGLPAWAAFSPSLADADVAVGDPSEGEDEIGGEPIAAPPGQ